MVVGDRGVGKSGFLRWFLGSSRFAGKLTAHHIDKIDIRNEPLSVTDIDEFIRALHERLSDTIKNYLNEIHDDPCHGLSKANLESDYNVYRKLSAKLNATEPKDQKLLLFIDDIDYVDESFFHRLLAQLKPMLACQNVSVILAARKPAYNSVVSHSDTTIGQFFEANSRVSLSHLSVKAIIEARLKLVRSDQTLLKDMYKQCLEGGHRVYKALANFITENNEYHSHRVDGFPFTDKQISFIQYMSNGNIKRMLSMSQSYLEYFASNPGELERSDDGQYIVGRSLLLKDLGNEGSYPGIDIINLHKRKSNQYSSTKDKSIPDQLRDNSLYVCVLEELASSAELNSTLRRHLVENYGFSMEEIEESITELKEFELIEEKQFVEVRTGSKDKGKLPAEYELTKRGCFYIDYMIHWNEYIELFGVSKHHKLGRSKPQSVMLRRALLEFLTSLSVAWEVVSVEHQPKKPRQQVRTDMFRIGKQQLFDSFIQLSQTVLVRINRTDRLSPLNLTLKQFEEMLLHLEVLKLHKLDKSSKYVVLVSELKRICNREGVPWEIAMLIDDELVTRTVSKLCSPHES